MDIDNEDGNQLQSSSTTISINGTNRHQFSINELLSMIDMIKKCELIWNKNHPEYSHGLSRAVAFEQIAQQLSIPGMYFFIYFCNVDCILGACD